MRLVDKLFMHIYDLNRKTYPTDGIKTVEHVEQNPIDCLQDNFEMPCVFFINRVEKMNQLKNRSRF